MAKSTEGLGRSRGCGKELAEARRILASIVESSDDAIISTTLDGVITSWNRSAERIFGYAAKEMIGRPVSLLYMPEDHNEFEILKRIRDGERVDHYETVRRHKNGQVVSVSLTLTVSPILDEAAQEVGPSKIARNITEAKHTRA